MGLSASVRANVMLMLPTLLSGQGSLVLLPVLPEQLIPLILMLIVPILYFCINNSIEYLTQPLPV